jgi:hypothetical protein
MKWRIRYMELKAHYDVIDQILVNVNIGIRYMELEERETLRECNNRH